MRWSITSRHQVILPPSAPCQIQQIAQPQKMNRLARTTSLAVPLAIRIEARAGLCCRNGFEPRKLLTVYICAILRIVRIFQASSWFTSERPHLRATTTENSLRRRIHHCCIFKMKLVQENAGPPIGQLGVLWSESNTHEEAMEASRCKLHSRNETPPQGRLFCKVGIDGSSLVMCGRVFCKPTSTNFVACSPAVKAAQKQARRHCVLFATCRPSPSGTDTHDSCKKA